MTAPGWERAAEAGVTAFLALVSRHCYAQGDHALAVLFAAVALLGAWLVIRGRRA